MKKLLNIVLLASVAWTAAAHAQVILIANPSVKSTVVSKSDLRDLFTGAESSFKDGSYVIPILLKDCDTHQLFLSTYIGKSDSEFRANWRGLVFSGQASMPKSIATESALVEYVAHTPGAISYISSATPHNGVKVLTVK